MRFDLDELFYIEGDGNYYSLHREEVTTNRSPKTGKFEVSKDIWHYSNFKSCLQSYLDKCIAPGNKTDCKEIIKKYDYVLNKIKELK